MSKENNEKLNKAMLGEKIYFTSAIGHDLTFVSSSAKLQSSCSSSSLALQCTS
jgi:hypothetical protein